MNSMGTSAPELREGTSTATRWAARGVAALFGTLGGLAVGFLVSSALKPDQSDVRAAVVSLVPEGAELVGVDRSVGHPLIVGPPETTAYFAVDGHADAHSVLEEIERQALQDGWEDVRESEFSVGSDFERDGIEANAYVYKTGGISPSKEIDGRVKGEVDPASGRLVRGLFAVAGLATGLLLVRRSLRRGEPTVQTRAPG